MHPALGSVTEALLTQIASHTYAATSPRSGHPERAGAVIARTSRCRIERGHDAVRRGIRSALPMSLAVALELGWCAAKESNLQTTDYETITVASTKRLSRNTF